MSSIAVVVLTFDRPHLLEQCIDNVLARTSELTSEILLVDNGLDSGTANILDKVPIRAYASRGTSATSGRTRTVPRLRQRRPTTSLSSMTTSSRRRPGGIELPAVILDAGDQRPGVALELDGNLQAVALGGAAGRKSLTISGGEDDRRTRLDRRAPTRNRQGDNPARCPGAGYRLCDPSILLKGQIQGGIAQGIG